MKQKINMFDVFEIKKHNKNYSYYKRSNPSSKGFTLLEVLMVIGILAILAGVVLVAINPARQFKIARDAQRNANVSTILNAIGQNLTDHGGVFTCEGVITEIPVTETNMSSDVDDFDIAPCLVPDYISILPFDPSKEGTLYVDETEYNTGYTITSDDEGRITISADGEVSGDVISVTR